jgi:sugar lactone lactonase YvrE
MTADRLLFRISVPIVLVMLLVFPIGFVHAFTNGQNATLEIGQAAGASQFTTQVFATTQSGLNLPHDVAFDHSGNLWVADTDNNRILEFTAPFSSGEAASLEIGQPAGASEFTTSGAQTTQSGLNVPEHIAFDSSGNLWVADMFNCRVLEFTAPFSSGEAASLEIGQPAGGSAFTSKACAVTQSGLEYPKSVAFDSSGNLWVVDRGNNRVLEYLYPFSNGMNANIEIGQPAGGSAFTTNNPTTSASGLSSPKDIAFNSGNLWVADGESRILEFTAPFSSGEAASVEIGQTAGATQFTSNTCATTQSGLCDVDGIAFDGSGNLWVGDHDNSRALEFAASSLGTDGPSAVGVLGQSGFTSGASSTTQSTLRGNSGLTFDSSGNLWVADNFNSRVLEFASVGGPIAPVSVCPNAGGGTLMPAGATFSYGGHTWTAPSGHDGEGATWSSYFFAGPQSTVPAPMLQGWAGVYGNYAGTQGWIITFYC